MEHPQSGALTIMELMLVNASQRLMLHNDDRGRRIHGIAVTGAIFAVLTSGCGAVVTAVAAPDDRSCGTRWTQSRNLVTAVAAP